MYACLRSIFAGYAHPAKRPPISEPPPHNTRNRSPIARATARSGSRATLTWAVLWLGVDVKHPPTARAELGGAIRRADGMSRSLRLATIDSRFRVVKSALRESSGEGAEYIDQAR